jgi:hypothetical protein
MWDLVAVIALHSSGRPTGIGLAAGDWRAHRREHGSVGLCRGAVRFLQGIWGGGGARGRPRSGAQPGPRSAAEAAPTRGPAHRTKHTAAPQHAAADSYERWLLNQRGKREQLERRQQQQVLIPLSRAQILPDASSEC